MCNFHKRKLMMHECPCQIPLCSIQKHLYDLHAFKKCLLLPNNILSFSNPNTHYKNYHKHIVLFSMFPHNDLVVSISKLGVPRI